MKKFIVALLLAAMAMASVTGCGKGGDSGQSGTAPETGADSAKTQDAGAADSGAAASGEVQDISLKVWCPQNQVDTGIMEQQQAAFAAEHPEYNITWTTEIVGEDKCQEPLLKDVGAAADVFMFASDHPASGGISAFNRRRSFKNWRKTVKTKEIYKSAKRGRYFLLKKEKISCKVSLGTV